MLQHQNTHTNASVSVRYLCNVVRVCVCLSVSMRVLMRDDFLLSHSFKFWNNIFRFAVQLIFLHSFACLCQRKSYDSVCVLCSDVSAVVGHERPTLMASAQVTQARQAKCRNDKEVEVKLKRQHKNPRSQ